METRGERKENGIMKKEKMGSGKKRENGKLEVGFEIPASVTSEAREAQSSEEFREINPVGLFA